MGDPFATGAVTLNNPVARAVPDRQSIIKEYEWAIVELDKVIDELAVRLSPVLTPYYADPSDCDPAPDTSEARARLMHLHGLISTLRLVIDRLEV